MIENLPKDLSEEELVQLIMKILDVDQAEARFILAIERGEIDGDIKVVADQ